MFRGDLNGQPSSAPIDSALEADPEFIYRVRVSARMPLVDRIGQKSA